MFKNPATIESKVAKFKDQISHNRSINQSINNNLNKKTSTS